MGLERREGKKGLLGRRTVIAVIQSLISSLLTGVYHWGGVSEMFIYFYVDRTVGALSISKFSKVWMKSWLSCFSEGIAYYSVGCIIFNKHLLSPTLH